jgi:hypothetical protein
VSIIAKRNLGAHCNSHDGFSEFSGYFMRQRVVGKYATKKNTIPIKVLFF